MPTHDDIAAQLELLRNHRQLLQISLVQLSGLSPLYAPPGVIKGVDDARSDPAETARLIAEAPEGFEVYSGDEPLSLAFAAYGAVGVLSVDSLNNNNGCNRSYCR